MTIPEVMAELEAARTALKPVIEGLEDYAALDLLPAAREVVTGLLGTYQRRLFLLGEAFTALDRLRADDYPVVGPVTVDPAAYADLQANLATITAAFQQFKTRSEAVGGSILFTDKP